MKKISNFFRIADFLYDQNREEDLEFIVTFLISMQISEAPQSLHQTLL